MTGERKADATRITRQSKSNLALAFISLGRERRRDITTFYAFCRVIDDIADSPELSVAEKAQGLAAWRGWITRTQLRGRRARRGGSGADGEICARPGHARGNHRRRGDGFAHLRYATFDDLRLYCYRVASAVGLVSIEIFGYRNPQCREYAIELGLALQTTNIIRDVGKDLRSGRIYLPQDELARFGYSEADLRARVYDERFLQLMDFQAQRARDYFARAAASAAARRSTLDDRRRNHGRGLSQPSATDGAGQFPRFRKRIPAQSIAESRSGCGAAPAFSGSAVCDDIVT